MSTHLRQQFNQFVKRYHLLETGDRILAAVSGGVDSMVLLDLLLRYKRSFGVEVAVVHLNHGLRGIEARKDALFVEDFCRSAGLPFFALQADVTAVSSREGLSREEAGHRLRKKMFEEIAENHNYQKIATAHHSDDQAETVLMRLLSGTGLKGLVGVRLKTDKWIRPLLFATREEIENYAKEQKIKYRLDESNRNTEILRNRIRHRLLPVLKKDYNPCISQHLSQISKLLFEWDDYQKQELERALEQGTLQVLKNKIILELTRFNQYFSWFKIHLLEFIVRQVGGVEAKLDQKRFDDYLIWLEKGRQGSEFSFGAEIFCAKYPGEAVFYRLQPAGTKVKIEPDKPVILNPAGIKLSITETKTVSITKNKPDTEEYLDGTHFQFPLFARPWQAGDRFIPLGMTRPKLVSDFLTDLKIRQPERRNVYVLEDRDRIAAVIGCRISEENKVTKNSKRIYHLNITTVD